MTTITRTVTTPITWENIKTAISRGKASEILSVGDIISIKLKDDTPIQIAVAGINIYNDNEAIFAFKDVLDARPMEKKDITTTNYVYSDMRRYLNSKLFELLPDELQHVIKERRGNKLWLFSHIEVFGEKKELSHLTCPEEDKQMPYFKNESNRKKTDDVYSWWLSSNYAGHYFAYVYNKTGICYIDEPTDNKHVAPGFVI